MEAGGPENAKVRGLVERDMYVYIYIYIIYIIYIYI